MTEDVAPEDAPRDGGQLLLRISNELVRVQKKFFGKGPTAAKSYMLDDVLIVVMRGGFTTAEQTMLELDGTTRSASSASCSRTRWQGA